MKRPAILAALCLSLAANGAFAQDDSGGGSGGAAESNDLDTRYVLPNFDFAVVLHPQRAWKSKPSQAVQGRDGWAEYVLGESGLDPRNMRRILLLFEIPTGPVGQNDGRPPRWKVPGIVVWTTEPMDGEKFVRESPIDEDSPLVHNGVTYWPSHDREREPAVAFPDKKTMLFSQPDVLLGLIDAHQARDTPPAASKLATRLNEADLDADLVFVGEIGDAKRRTIQNLFAGAGRQLPPNVNVLVEGLLRSEAVEARVDLSDAMLARASLEVEGEEPAEQLETVAREGIQGIAKLLDALVAFSEDPQVTERITLIAGVLRGTKVERDGSTVLLAMRPPADWSSLTRALDDEISKMLGRVQRRQERQRTRENDF